MTHPCVGPVVTRRWVEPHGEERSERVCLRCGGVAGEAEPWVVPVACDGGDKDEGAEKAAVDAAANGTTVAATSSFGQCQLQQPDCLFDALGGVTLLYAPVQQEVDRLTHGRREVGIMVDHPLPQPSFRVGRYPNVNPTMLLVLHEHRLQSDGIKIWSHSQSSWHIVHRWTLQTTRPPYRET